MTAIAKTKPKEQRIDLRVSTAAKALLQRAAVTRHKSTSEFILGSAQMAAAEVLAECRGCLLDKKQCAAFLDTLVAPPNENPDWKNYSKSRDR